MTREDQRRVRKVKHFEVQYSASTRKPEAKQHMVFSGFIYLLVDLLGCEVNLSKLVITIIYHKVSFRTLFGNNFENPPLNHPPGGGLLPIIMAYTGRLRLKGVPFSGFRYIKG